MEKSGYCNDSGVRARRGNTASSLGTQSPAGLSAAQGQLERREKRQLPKVGAKNTVCGARATSSKALAGRAAADPFHTAAGGARPPPSAQARLRQGRTLSLVLKVAAASVPCRV
ncbi:hypothetical protein AAY473_019224 [Plecturocebus cupreus]